MERRRSQRGQAIVLVALMMAVLIGFVALALDSARAFDGRRVLQDSVDAAALTAAESLQNGGVNWGQAQLNAITIFQKDNRLPVGPASCSPSTFFTPNPGSPGTAVTTTCSMSGGGGYVLTLNVADNGPAGQVFALSATRPLSGPLRRVLGQPPPPPLTAAGAATAGDQSVTPALAGLSRPSCSSGTYPITISSFTNFATVVGDVVSNGPAYLGTNSYLHLAGDLLASCSTNSNADHVTYQCWSQPPTLPPAAPPCTGNAVLGQLRSTANHFADPGYLPPSTAGLTTPGFVSGNIHLAPGIYTTDPQFGSPSNSYCYFLAGGVYNWQARPTISHGIVSNELKPPDEPLFNNNQALAAQFWNDNRATCAGSYSLTTGTLSGKGIGTGTWSVVV